MVHIILLQALLLIPPHQVLDDEQTRKNLLRLMSDSTIAADFLLYPDQWKEEKLRDLLDLSYP